MKKLISHSNYSMPRCLSAQPGFTLGLRTAAVLLCLWGLLALPARAATTYWNPQANSGRNPYTDNLSGSWENANWSTKPNGQHTPQNWVTNTTAAFAVRTGVGTPAFTVTMNANHTVAGILNGSGTGSGACDVTITGSGNIMVPSGLQSFNASNSGGANGYLRLEVPLTGTGAVVAEGNGQLFFHGANTYTGGTYLGYGNAPWNGTLNFSNSAAFSTGPIVIGRSGGTLQLEGTEALTLANAVIATNTPATNVLHLAGNLTFSGPWTLGVATQLGITGAGNVVTLSGVISGAGALTKSAPGTLVLAGANTYTGATTVNQGTLAFAGGSLGASAVTVAAGATLANTTTDPLALGGSVTLNAGALAAVNLADGVAGKLSVAGDLALNNNVLSIKVSGQALVPGSYRLLECAGTLSGAAAALPALSGTPLASGLTASVATVTGPGGYVDLLIQTAPAFSGLTVSPAVTYGANNLLLSGTLSADGPLYPAQGDSISVTINGNTQNATIADATGNFSLTYDASALTVDASPYTITYAYAGNAWLSGATDTSTALTVNPAPLTVTADDATRGFGAENPPFTGTLVGLLNGDAITAAYLCSATATSGLGQYPIVPSLLDPSNRLTNYAVTAVNGTLTVGCPVIAVNPPTGTLPNGALDVAYSHTLTATGSLGAYSFTVTSGSTPAGLDLSVDGVLSGTPSAPGTNVFTVTATDTNGCTGSQACTLVVGVAPAISVQPASQTNLIAGAVQFTVTAAGDEPLSYQWLFNGTNLTDDVRLSGSQSNSLSISNLFLSDAGSYTVVVANAFGSATSAEAVLTVQLATPVFSGLTVTPAITYGETSLTLAGSLSAAGGLYPAQDETITVTINGNTQSTTVNDATGDFSLTYDTTAFAADASPYTITYAYAGNDSLTAATDASTALTVNKAALTVTANDASRNYGEENPAFSAMVVGVLNGDAITATASCDATSASLPGSYPIVPSLLDPNNRLGNYAVTALNGTLTIPDPVAPTVAITSSVSAVVHDAALTLSGTASDDVAVESVLYQLNNASWTPATTTDGWTNWTVSLTLTPGTNVISVKSRDFGGGLSPFSTVSVVYVPLALVTVQVQGEGTVTPDLNGQLLPVGQTYTLTAVPSDGYAFSSWTGGLTASTPEVTFTLQSNLVLLATFVPTTFPAKGTYTGLFYETNAVAPASSGTFTLTTTAGRRFSGSLRVAGVRYALRGAFNTNGLAEVLIPAHKPNALHVALQMDLKPGADRIDGTVGDGTWTAALAGDRVVYDGKKHVAPEHGAYTLVIPGSDEPADEPSGNGYGTVSVSKAGRIHLAATLADGTKLSQSAIVSKYGQWPLYRSLYNRHGLLLGWLNFTNDPAATLHLGGDLSWLKPGSTRKYYPGGFMVQPTAVGARWTAPAKDANVVTFASGSVMLSGGNLSQSLTNAFEFGLKFKVLDQSGNDLRLKFSRSSGAFTGSVFDPVSEQRIPFGGVLLQGLNTGYGCFLGTDQSGQVFLGQ